MPKKLDEGPGPLEYVARWERSANYPKSTLGVSSLAMALKRAADTHRVPMLDIVEECLRTSAYCPTDYDLESVATQLRASIDAKSAPNNYAKWEAEYGPPKPVPLTWDRAEVAKYKAREREMWAKLKKLYPKGWPDWLKLAGAARELGYENYARAWERGTVDSFRRRDGA